MRADTAGATHELIDYCRDARHALLGRLRADRAGPRRDPRSCPSDAWVAALDQDGSERDNGAGRRDHRPASTCRPGRRARGVIVRRERPHPGAQLSLHRPRRPPLPGDPHRPARPRHRRARAPPPRSAPASRTASATTRTPAWRNLPFRDFALNQVWLELVLLAHDLIVWTQALLLDGELATRRAQAAALPAAARRRPARLPRPPRHAAPPSQLALGRRTRRRVRAPRRAPRLTPRRTSATTT